MARFQESRLHSEAKGHSSMLHQDIAAAHLFPPFQKKRRPVDAAAERGKMIGDIMTHIATIINCNGKRLPAYARDVNIVGSPAMARTTHIIQRHRCAMRIDGMHHARQTTRQTNPTAPCLPGSCKASPPDPPHLPAVARLSSNRPIICSTPIYIRNLCNSNGYQERIATHPYN